MPRRKMIPSLPDSLAGSEHDRFKGFATALPAVPKSEITPIEQILAKLEADKLKNDAKIVKARRELRKKRSG